MTDNVITFPKKVETVEIKGEDVAAEEAHEFANEIIEFIHDAFHDRTGECIFTDEEYMPLTICIGEVLTSLYMLSQGHEHPFQDIANEIFGDGVDKDKEEVYSGENLNNEEP